MNTQDAQYVEDVVEPVIDRLGLNDTIQGIAEICRGKAEHLRTNWQDATSARLWDRAASRLEKLSFEI
jgi:hypothetical protein